LANVFLLFLWFQIVFMKLNSTLYLWYHTSALKIVFLIYKDTVDMDFYLILFHYKLNLFLSDFSNVFYYLELIVTYNIHVVLNPIPHSKLLMFFGDFYTGFIEFYQPLLFHSMQSYLAWRDMINFISSYIIIFLTKGSQGPIVFSPACLMYSLY